MDIGCKMAIVPSFPHVGFSSFSTGATTTTQRLFFDHDASHDHDLIELLFHFTPYHPDSHHFFIFKILKPLTLLF